MERKILLPTGWLESTYECVEGKNGGISTSGKRSLESGRPSLQVKEPLLQQDFPCLRGVSF